MADTDSPETLVERLCREIETLYRDTAHPAPDAEMNARVAALFEAITKLAQVPATNPAELLLKLDVLCRRLGEYLDPTDWGGVLTYLLATSIQNDCRLALHRRNSDQWQDRWARFP